MSNNHFEGNIAGERMSFLNWKSENDTAAPSPLLSRKGELQRRKAAAALELQRCRHTLPPQLASHATISMYVCVPIL